MWVRISPKGQGVFPYRFDKLWLYSRHGVLEYWIINWIEQRLEIYRRHEAQLKLHSTLYKTDTVQSPHLPGFTCQVSQFFDDIPSSKPPTIS